MPMANSIAGSAWQAIRFPTSGSTGVLRLMSPARRHGCWLLDACPHCGAPISFHESDFGTLATGLEEGILRCRRCMGLRTDVELSFEEVSDELLQFSATTDDRCRAGV